jgi:hypothetical protein
MPAASSDVKKKNRDSTKLRRMAKQGRVFSELVKLRHTGDIPAGTIAEAVQSLSRSQVTLRRSY